MLDIIIDAYIDASTQRWVEHRDQLKVELGERVIEEQGAEFFVYVEGLIKWIAFNDRQFITGSELMAGLIQSRLIDGLAEIEASRQHTIN